MKHIPASSIAIIYSAIQNAMDAAKMNYPVWDQLNTAKSIVKVYLLDDVIEFEVTKDEA